MDERAQRAAEEIGEFMASQLEQIHVSMLVEIIERHMNQPYICTCGQRVEPHVCSKETEF